MQTKLLSTDRDDIRYAGGVIKSGGLVGFPTETVYGLGANALDAEAVKKIFAAKGRPADNPLIVHISRLEQWRSLVKAIPESALKLAEAFWPGPLTVILEKKDIVPYVTSGGLDTVAVRMPSDETARRLIDAAGIPIAAPSANTSGKPSPTTAKHVFDDMNGKIEAIIDGGKCGVGVESTVVTLVSDVPTLLRPGGITPEMLESVLGKINIDDAVYSKLKDGVKATSPGMKYKHYSPKARVTLVKGSFDKFKKYISSKKDENIIALVFDGEENGVDVKAIPYGDEKNSLSQAQNIFAALREVDELGASFAYVRYPSREGVGLAVYNRLIRAAAFEVIEL